MFLPGQDDINKAVKMLNEGIAALPPDSCMDLLVLPIYAALPPDLQVPFLLPVHVLLLHASSANPPANRVGQRGTSTDNGFTRIASLTEATLSTSRPLRIQGLQAGLWPI